MLDQTQKPAELPVRFTYCPDFNSAETKEMPWGKFAATVIKSVEYPDKEASLKRSMIVGGVRDDPTKGRADNVKTREIITLDYDNLAGVSLADIELALELNLTTSWVAYTTFRHTPEAPRVRIMAPLSRTVSAAEYEAIVASVVASLDIGKADKCSKSVNYGMFLASHTEGVEPWSAQGGTGVLDVDALGLIITAEPETEVLDLEAAIASQPLDLSDADVAALLENYPAKGLGYSEWFVVCTALHHQYVGSEKGFKIFDDWCALDPEGYPKKTSEHPRKKWQSIRGNSTSPVTMASVIKAAGGLKGGGTTVWDMSQDGLALELGRTGFDQDARYVAPWGKWVFWSGTRWQIDNKLSVMTKTRCFLRNKADALLEWAATHDDPKVLDEAKRQGKGIKSKNTVAAIESLARSNLASIAAPEDFDTNLMTLGTPSGVVDLRTGELRPARREDMITKETAYSPADAGAVPTRWLKFLGEIFDEDQELIDFMQRVAGYSLTGETREHKLIFLYGTGRNGKSVFLNTLYEILGDYATRSASETFMASKGDKHATGLAGLKGARLVAGSELAKGKTWDEAVIKDLTGGDVISARYMRGDFFDFVPQMTLIIAGNDQPSFRGVDPAIRARVVLVPFTVRIPAKDRDEHLQDKLRAEAPAILRWAIDGCVAWEKTGLRPPKRVTEASDEYLDTEDLFGQFLADCLVEKSGDFTSTTDIFAAYQNWCQNHGTHPWSRNAVVKELKSRNFEAKATMAARGFQHVALAAGASAAVAWEFPAAEGN
jgi:P4 family phage/plasmid primase-like protien